MSEQSNSVISLNKTKTSIGSYLWNSPCLKPLFYNPFILSALLLFIIWMMDFIYGKGFLDYENTLSLTFQRMITTYIIVASGTAINNMMIRYRCKMDKYEKNSESSETISETISEPITTTYVESF